MFGKLITNILMCFMKPCIDNAVEQMRNDPDIKRKFKELEHALQDLKDAMERENEFRNSQENKAALDYFGIPRIKY